MTMKKNSEREQQEREQLEQAQLEREQLWRDRFCQLAVKFLVGGLMSRRQPVRDRCAEVLIAFGTDVTDRLREILKQGNLSTIHRKRVSAVIASAAAREPSPDRTSQLLNSIPWMILHNDMELVRPGLALSRYMPRNSLTDILVDEALSHQADSLYFDRLLRAVEVVKEIPSSQQCNGLVGIYLTESGPLHRSCKRLLEKIDRGEIGDQSWAAGFRHHHLSVEDLTRWPDENVIPLDPFPELSDPMWLKGFHYHPSPALPGTN